MSRTARQTRHSYLNCFVVHGDFMTREALLRTMNSDDSQWSLLLDNKLKSLFDTWQLLEEQRDKRKNDASLAARKASWQNQLLTWMNFTNQQGFVSKNLQLDNDCSVIIKESPQYSVAVWDLMDSEDLQTEPTAELDSIPSSVRIENSILRKISLAEWAEMILKRCGHSDLLVIFQNRMFWFRADVVTASGCLQVNLDDALKADALEGMALVGHLLGSASFLESASAEVTAESIDEASSLEESDDSDEESDSEDEEEGSAAGGELLQSRATRASEWLKEDLEQQRKITEDLHKQVTIAIEMLVNAYLEHNCHRLPQRAKMEQASFEVFKDGLFFIYRILFVLFAEARGRLPGERTEFSSFYSLSGVLDWCDAFEKRTRMGAIDPNGTHVWQSLRSIFTLLRRGVSIPGELNVAAFNGQLFAPDQCQTFDHADPIPDKALVPVLLQLTTKSAEGRRERLNYSNLETAQLGAVYEALLAQRAKYLAEDHVWVESSGGSVGLVPLSWVKGVSPTGYLDYKIISTGYTSFEIPKSSLSTMKRDRFEQFIDPKRPAKEPRAGKFVICPSGGAKRQTASFYTPKKLAQFLAYRTLKPLLEECKNPEDVLKLKILEPSVGCGAFLVAAMNFVAQHLLKLAATDRRPAAQILGGIFGKKADPRDPEDVLKAKRAVVENCLFGVDTNPLSLELCRVILYLESLATDRPLPFLHHHLKQGNALIGADLSGKFARTFAGKKLNWAFIPSTNVFGTQAKGKDNLISKYEAYHTAAEKLGEKVPDLEKLKKTFEDMRKDYSDTLRSFSNGKSSTGSEALQFTRWAEKHQQNINRLLGEAARLEEQFENFDKREGGVDDQDAIFNDWKKLIPESDELLIEAWGIELPPQLAKMRKEALKREFNQKVYKILVHGSRASQRLRAFAHLATALHAWAFDVFNAYPKFKEYQKICDVLLATPLDQSIPRQSISKREFASLRAALSIGQRMGFFHVELEFPHIMQQGGFSACLGNPPWKVVGVKDKNVVPKTDPGFLFCKPSQKANRLERLSKHTTDAARQWWEENHLTASIANFWSAKAENESLGALSYIGGSGQLDLCTLFLLRSEGLIRPAGTFGYVVSHSGIFVTKNTTALRERMFSKMNLSEAVVFENRQKIFDIATYMTFAALIARPGTKEREAANFVQGVTDLGDLDLCAGLLDGATPGPNAKLECVPLSKDLIQTAFSPTLLSIPLITNRREVAFLEELLKNSKRFVRFSEKSQSCSGTHGTSGPKKGLSIYTERLSEQGHKIPSMREIFMQKSPFIPQYKGEMGGHFDPLFPGAAADPCLQNLDQKLSQWIGNIKQFGVPANFADSSQQRQLMGEVKLAWRKIGRSSDQRTLIPFLAPDGSWADDSLYFAAIEKTYASKILGSLSSLIIDNIIRYQVTSNVTSGVVNDLPLDLTETKALQRAGEIALDLSNLIPDSTMPPKWKALMAGRERVVDPVKRRSLQAELDALIYIHYSRESSTLTAEDFKWMIEHRFKALCRNSPEFVQAVFEAIDRLWPEREHWRATQKSKRLEETVNASIPCS